MPTKRVVNAARLAAGFGVVLVIAAWVQGISAQQRPQADIDIVQVRPNFYMLAGGGANIGVSVGPEGFVLVDSGSAAMADKVLQAIDKLAQLRKTTEQDVDILPKIRYIFNTSAHPDHVGGNDKLAKAGLSIFPTAGGAGLGNFLERSGGAAILAHDNVTQRMSAAQEPSFPETGWPTEGYTGRLRSYYLNDEGIQFLYQPAATSDGDSFVTFRESDVIVAGEIFDLTRFPMIDMDKGGSIQGELDALNRLVDMAIPAVPFPWKERRTYVIPARGRVADQADLVEYRDIMTFIRDAVQDMIGRGMTLEQIQRADPAKAFRVRFGSDPSWTTDMFIDVIYKGLTAKKS